MKLPNALKKYAHMIAEISDERGDEDGYWVYLNLGWQDGENPTCHTIHEDTITGCAQAMRGVVPCTGKCCERTTHAPH